MGIEQINRVIMQGNLTHPPELRYVSASNTPVCTLRLACNGRRPDSSGEWEDRPDYIDVVVWGPQGENCDQYLSKGDPVIVEGRLLHERWQAKGDGGNRSRHVIEVGKRGTVVFANRGGGGGRGVPVGSTVDPPFQDLPDEPHPEEDGFTPAADLPDDSGGTADDDIPF